MAFHIEKPSSLNPDVTVYYVKKHHWSDNPDLRKSWKKRSSPENLLSNPDGTNGGWEKATIVEE